MKIGFVTCHPDKLSHFFPTLAEPEFIPSEAPFTPDDQLAVDALRREGHAVFAVIWGQPIESLNDYDLLIIRSPWDYMDDEESKKKFHDWIDAIEKANILVSNPVPVLKWLFDKHYLAYFSAEEINTIPTVYLEPSSQVDLSAIFNLKGPFILKPCISAAGEGLFYIKNLLDAQNYQAVINDKLRVNSYMLQDYVPEITEKGEWSLIFIGGVYSHAVHKRPADDSIFVHAERGGSLFFPVNPSQSIINFATRVNEKLTSAFRRATTNLVAPHLILYLRIDIIDTKEGPVLVECEGLDPELFFRAEVNSVKLFTQKVNNIILN